MKSLLSLLAFMLITCDASQAQNPRRETAEGFSGDVTFDYDGSRHRTASMHGGIGVEWPGEKFWTKLDFDTYTDFSKHWALRDSAYGALGFGAAIHKDHKDRLYINALVEVSGPSQLADKGVDFDAKITVAKGLNADWWLGGDLERIFSTSRNPGNRSGYLSVTTWAMWFSRWLPNDSDAFKFSIWAATNEVPDDDNALFLSLEYEFDITDSLDASIGIGTDPSSPWERKGIFATAGLRWSF
jgi:hypothetical protein